jgi:hypothetical protein
MAPTLVESDGAELWVPNLVSGSVSRVRGSDGKVTETWSGATSAYGVVVAMGQVFVTGATNPGVIYQIDPRQPVGAVQVLQSIAGIRPHGIAFDGARLWTANLGSPGVGSVTSITLSSAVENTVTSGFSRPEGILYDGSNIWVTDSGDNTLKQLDAAGKILHVVPVGSGPQNPVFDGINIWVPNSLDNTVTVVRAATAAVLQTLSGNGLRAPMAAAFDGQRIMVTNFGSNLDGGSGVSLWKAADLTPLGSVVIGGGIGPFGACSDGLNFWITHQATNKLVRF